MGQVTNPAGMERGFALISAVFLMLILAAMGAFMLTMSGVQNATVSQSISASRVYYGARSGLEWVGHQAVAPALGSAICDTSTTFSAPQAGLDGISIKTTCSVFNYCKDKKCKKQTSTFRITSTASYGSLGSANYAERKLSSVICRSTEETAANPTGNDDNDNDDDNGNNDDNNDNDDDNGNNASGFGDFAIGESMVTKFLRRKQLIFMQELYN